VDRLIAETERYPPPAQIQARLGPLASRLGQIRERIAAIDRELAELEQQVLARCKILATTVYRTYLGKSEPRQFDAVVVDEASMLMPPLVYHAAGLATQSVTVAGDFRQLPPIVMSNEPLAAEWLKCDVFEKARIPEQLAPEFRTKWGDLVVSAAGFGLVERFSCAGIGNSVGTPFSGYAVCLSDEGVIV
jgi:hypothetical protein